MAGQPSSQVQRAALGLAALALGCSVQAVDDSAQAEAGSTHALISIARHAPAAAPDDARADAFAGFLRTTGEAASVLRVAGLSLELPAAGECKKTTHGAAAGAAPLARIELLDVGEVTLAAGGNVTTLAPRAFPTVIDSISGVVYTTRDRASTPLPAASGYTVATTGGSSLGPLSGEAPAPAVLSGITLSGVPFAEVESLRSNEDLKLTWDPGSAGDHVYVEIDAEATSTLCAFRDDLGRGAVTARALPSNGAAALSVHRLRQASFGDVGLSHGELRFDFELSLSVSFE